MASTIYRVYRILDANFNRSREAARVLEEFARFQLDHKDLAARCKTLRHSLAELLILFEREAGCKLSDSRDTLGDVGTKLNTPLESKRDDASDVVTANLKRLQESLRSLEEYGKIVSSEAATEMKVLRYQVYTLEQDFRRMQYFENVFTSRVMVIASTNKWDNNIKAIAAATCAAGIGILQLRMKEVSDRQYHDVAITLADLMKDGPTALVLNDRADIASQCHAAGVHLGQDDIPVATARRILGGGAIIGVTAATPALAKQAADDGADYIGVGAAFPTTTKSNAVVCGIDTILAVQAAVNIPVYAIGGITAENVSELITTGVQRVAIGSTLLNSPNPATTLQSIIDQVTTKSF